MKKEKKEEKLQGDFIKVGANYFIQNLQYARDAVDMLENDAKESWKETGVEIDFERFTVIRENVMSYLDPTQWAFDSDETLKSAPNLIYQAEEGNYIYLISAAVQPGNGSETAVACLKIHHECGIEQDTVQQFDFEHHIWVAAECDVCACGTNSGYAS